MVAIAPRLLVDARVAASPPAVPSRRRERHLQPEHEGVADSVVDSMCQPRSGEIARASPGERHRHAEQNMYADGGPTAQGREVRVTREVPDPPKRRNDQGRFDAACLPVSGSVVTAG